jgi:DNA-binding MarR family transcriptional regulator
MSSRIREEIKQGKPFKSAGQEATVALLRTASVIGRGIARQLEPWGLSTAQYNALRIIRGAGTAGIATLAIRERMIEEGTTITRIVEKLATAGLIRRERQGGDRRLVICVATAAGKRLLDDADPVVDRADETAMEALSAKQVAELIALLDRIRSANAARGAPRSALKR